MSCDHDHHPTTDTLISGAVTWADTDEPAAAVVVELHGTISLRPLGRAGTDDGGRFILKLDETPSDECDASCTVLDRSGRILLPAGQVTVRLDGRHCQALIALPGRPPRPSDKGRARPTVKVGPLELDAHAVARATPEVVLDVARAIVNTELSKEAAARVHALLPQVQDRLVDQTLCGTAILQAIEALVEMKGWPREVLLEVDDILAMREFGFGFATYDCPNFTITYQDAGPGAVPPSTASEDVLDPGAPVATILANLPAGGPPTYIKRVCFWLERALSAYVNAPFSMLNPAGGGKIPVVINTDPYGSASPSGTFYLNNNLNPDLLCAVTVHELFHMVQFMYGGSGAWQYSVFEGGAVFAEDTAADYMNRYLDEAAANFNGTGVQVNPNLSLASGGYKASLFWRYVAEQQSSDLTEPFVGVETYRRILERCSAGSYSAADVRQAIRELPWYQDFYEFGYLDPAKVDRTSSETTLGNYSLACHLKDLGVNQPDKRFDFIEDEENIYIDSVISEPPSTTLVPVALSGSATVTTSASALFSSSVNTFASRHYEIAVDPAVTNVAVTFTAGAGLTSSIFQLALIDEDGLVRDIHRTDLASYAKRITNVRAGKKLAKIVVVVTGANSSGTFTVAASSAAPAPDVMVTRWHSIVTREYEIDSYNYAWTWVSPDIWVDNDGDGAADGVVFFNTNNKLHVRLHNKGNAAASGIQVEFWYQDASGGLGVWLPVQDTGATTQVLTGLSLAAGASNDWFVNWSPVPSGASHHFCVRVAVTVPGDPNTDNKRALSNFGNVVVPFAHHADIDLVRRNIFDVAQPITMRVVPRLTPELQVSTRDLRRSETAVLGANEAVRDAIRLSHRDLKGVYVHEGHDPKMDEARCAPPARLGAAPDPAGFYPTDPRALPPGVAGRPMITVVHEIDGLPVGGVSYLVTVEEAKP